MVFNVCDSWLYARHELILLGASPNKPNSGNCIANRKGVHCEVESERSWRQTSDLTYRNFI